MNSPTETWRPNYERSQSWCQEDLKRQIMQAELGKRQEEGVDQRGFTEEGEERKT